MPERVQFLLFDSGKVKERFVDGIDFRGRAEAAQGLLNAPRHIAIKGIVAGIDRHIVPFDKRLQLEVRMPHLDAEPFRLIRTRNHTSVIVGEDNDGFPVEVGSEHPLTGDEEVVAIGESEHFF